MRILQVIPRYAPAWVFGGGVRMAYELAKAWTNLGHQVTVFTSDQCNEYERFLVTDDNLQGIRIKRFRNINNYLAAKYGFFFYPLGMSDALSNLRDQFDIVHVYESRGAHDRMAARHLVSQNIPFVWSPYGGLADGEGLRKVYRRCYDLLFNTRNLVCRVSGLIAQTSHEEHVFRSFGTNDNKIKLIPLCVDWDSLVNLPERGSFRKKIGMAENEKMVLFLGRIHWTKGLQNLIPAFAKVSAQIENVRLVVAGWNHGFLRDAKRLVVKHALQTRVIFPGEVSREDRFSAYIDADIFALTPPIYEETSLAALEACACGTSCVITKHCEIPGLETAGAGVLVEYDINKTANALMNALQGNIAQIRGMNARRMVQDNFTVSIVAQRHIDFFQDVISAHKT